MSNRLNQEREKKLEPKRMRYAREKIEKLGYTVTSFGGKRLEFEHDGEIVKHWAYSGWHSGKSIDDGRGIHHLLNQLKS